MKYTAKTRAAAILAALLLACTVTSCGGGSSAAEGSQSAENSSAEQNSAAEDSESGGEEESQSGGDAGDSRSGNSSGEESGSPAEPENSENGGENSKSQDESSRQEKTDSKSSSENSKSGSENSKSSSSKAGTESSKTESSKASPGETSQTDDEDDDTVKPMKYIYLNDSQVTYSGDGIYVEGSKITISKGGHYQIEGTLSNGQIYIMTDKKKVKLFLNNASITNKAGAAINCQDAKKLTLTTLAGTVNKLSDGGTHDADKAAVFSEDTVSLEGEGTLEITGVYAHGIESDDDIRVNGGTVRITSTKSGLKSKDGIEINGGTLFCDGGTNGIKTDGYVTITGGSSVLLGGTREEKGAIYCDGALTVTGGNLWAIGNTCSLPDGTTTTANVVGLVFSNPQPANSPVTLKRGSAEVFTMTSPRGYKYVVHTGPNLLNNAEYSIVYGGTLSGGKTVNYVTTGGSISGGTDGGTFTASEKVTFHTIM